MEGPKLVSADPANGVKDIKGDKLTIVLTFDQNIKCPPSQQVGISIDGRASIESVYAYMKDLTIKVKGLESGNSYVVTIPSGAVQGYSEGQKGCDQIIYSFATKEEEVFFHGLRSHTKRQAERKSHDQSAC